MPLSNKYFFIILLLFCTCNQVDRLQAQSIFRDVSSFPSEDTNERKETYIYFPSGNANAYETLFKKLDQLIFEGEGNVTVLHIGGSHIQAGTLSHQIRTNLLNMFPGLVGSRGMIFPFSAAKTNNPLNYRTTYTGIWEVNKNTVRTSKYPLGLTGMCVSTNDLEASITIRLKNNDGVMYDFNTVYVLGHCDSGAMRVMLQIEDSAVIEGVYDSAKLAYSFSLPFYTNAFTLYFEEQDSTWGTFCLRGFWLDNNLPGISYVDIGVNGTSVPSYLRCSYLENDLAFVKPDLCIFSIGINDASGTEFDTTNFQNNYKELIRRIRKVSPDCAILFTTNNDSFRKVGKRYYNNENGLLAQQAFYSLANYYDAGVWDLFSFMGGLNSMKLWEAKGLAQKDKVHFTPQGYRLIGDLIYNAFVAEYINNLKNNHIIHGLE
jgi:lysophospholipase L1-like esterase